MIEIRSLRDLLRLLFIYQREFKLAALSAVVIIVLGAFLLPAKYESNARLLVKPGRDSTLPIEISNRQALVMPSTQRDPIVDEERLLTGRPIVRQVAERYLEVLANRPPPEGLWKRTKFYVKKAIGAVFDGIRVTFIIEQLRRLLEENGVRVRIGGEPAQPGEVVLLDAPALLDSREAFIALRRADLIALVVEAQKSTVPVVEHALTILTTAFGKVDGIIINRRRFEVPSKVLQTIARYRSAF
ncbi:TPA: hypothetical protein ACKPZG_003635 [Pseudomonas aeruginosa]